MWVQFYVQKLHIYLAKTFLPDKPADFTLQVFTISRYFKNCTQKRNILTTISLLHVYFLYDSS